MRNYAVRRVIRDRAVNNVVYEDVPYWQVLSMKKEVVFDEGKCRLDEGTEEEKEEVEEGEVIEGGEE
jgi:hypothetical protein